MCDIQLLQTPALSPIRFPGPDIIMLINQGLVSSMVAHTCSASIQGAEAAGSPIIQGHSELQNKFQTFQISSGLKGETLSKPNES